MTEQLGYHRSRHGAVPDQVEVSEKDFAERVSVVLMFAKLLCVVTFIWGIRDIIKALAPSPFVVRI